MVLFAEINQAPSPYSMLQHIGKVATPKLVPRNCLRYLQTTLQCVTTRYRQIYKKYILIVFLKNDGNALQIAENQANLKENIW